MTVMNKNGDKYYPQWIRQGVVLLERVRSFFTDQEIKYLIKDTGTNNTIILSEYEIWNYLLNSSSTSKGDINISDIVNATKDTSGIEDWARIYKETLEDSIIKNRINFMEDFYQRNESIEKYDDQGYRTFYKKYREKNKIESNKHFEKRKAEKEFPPLWEYQYITLLKRYNLYKESNNTVSSHTAFFSRHWNRYFIINNEQLVVETASKRIIRFYANKGDLYEAVVHGAANILPKNEEEEQEQLSLGGQYNSYIINAKIANIDNMIGEKDNTDYIKTGDNYLSIAKSRNKKTTTILQTKLSNGAIKRNTTIQLLANLNRAFKDYKKEKDSEKLIKDLQDLFEKKIKEEDNVYTENQAESVAMKIADERIKTKIEELIK